MVKYLTSLFLCGALFFGNSLTAKVNENASSVDKGITKLQSEIFTLFVNGEFEKLGTYMNKKVFLMECSELLKPEWGVVKKGNGNDPEYKVKEKYVKKGKLIHGLNQLKKDLAEKGMNWEEMFPFLLSIDNSEIAEVKIETKTFTLKKFNDTKKIKVKNSQKGDIMFVFYNEDEPVMFIIRNKKIEMFYFD